MNATDTISNWIVNTSYEDMPPEVIQAARESYFDCMGVALSGSVQPLGKIITEYVREQGGTPESTVLGSGIRTSAIWVRLSRPWWLTGDSYCDLRALRQDSV